MTNNKVLELLKTKLSDFQSLKTVKSHLDSTNKQLSEKYTLLKNVSQQLNKEEADLKKLEEGGLKAVFYKVLGDKEAQLEKERQEYLAVSLKYNALKEEIELLEFEKDVLDKKLTNIPALEKEIAQLKKQRAHEILQTGDSTLRSEFMQLNETLDFNIMLEREIVEAIDAGRLAMANVAKLAAPLRQALDWGRWQGGGRGMNRASMMRRNSLVNANRMLASAQVSLNKFSKELSDLGEKNMRFVIDFSELKKFTDFFFDNLITDWIIQQKIRNSLHQLGSTNDKINRIIQSLEIELKKTKEKHLLLHNQREQLLMSN